MISLQTLWLNVRDLSRKDNIGGYLGNDEFNRQVALAQTILFDYYYARKNETEARETLAPFQQSSLIKKASGAYALPDDYRNKLDAGLAIGNIYKPVHFPARDELMMSLSSPVRGPSLERNVIVGELRDTDIQVWPDTDYKLFLRYYQNPPVATRAVTVDVSEIEEVYDDGSTINLIWPAEKIQDFIDMLLLFKGLAIRDSSLIEWVQGHRMIQKTIAGDER